MSEEKNINHEPESNNNAEDVNEIASQEQAIEQSKTQSENMEVHHHPDLHHKKKDWKEYFLEFLMIFLAVTLGFFAESLREHISDGSRERDYIKSMNEDLKTDSTFLVLSTNKLIPYHLAWMDSTVHLLEMPDSKGKARMVYQAFLVGTAWTYNFHPTEHTLTQ